MVSIDKEKIYIPGDVLQGSMLRVPTVYLMKCFIRNQV